MTFSENKGKIKKAVELEHSISSLCSWSMDDKLIVASQEVLNICFIKTLCSHIGNVNNHDNQVANISHLFKEAAFQILKKTVVWKSLKAHNHLPSDR